MYTPSTPGSPPASGSITIASHAGFHIVKHEDHVLWLESLFLYNLGPVSDFLREHVRIWMGWCVSARRLHIWVLPAVRDHVPRCCTHPCNLHTCTCIKITCSWRDRL